MKLGMTNICLLVIAFAPSAVLALSAHPNHGLSWSKDRSVHRKLIKEVHIAGEDNRGALSKIHDQIGMSSDEAKLYTQAMGQCICTTRIEEISTTCSMIGFNDRVWTNLHAFIYPTSAKLLNKKDLETCQFQKFGQPKVIRRLIFKRNSYAFATTPGNNEDGPDMAVVMLDKPINDVTPIPMVRSFTKLRKDTTVLNVSGHQRAMKVDVIGEPVGQSCRVLGNWTDPPTTVPAFATDCDTKQGGSGGLVLARIGGNLLVVGMTVRAPVKERYDGQEADLDEGLYTKNLYFSDQLIQMASAPTRAEVQRPKRAGKASAAK